MLSSLNLHRYCTIAFWEIEWTNCTFFLSGNEWRLRGAQIWTHKKSQDDHHHHTATTIIIATNNDDDDDDGCCWDATKNVQNPLNHIIIQFLVLFNTHLILGMIIMRGVYFIAVGESWAITIRAIWWWWQKLSLFGTHTEKG